MNQMNQITIQFATHRSLAPKTTLLRQWAKAALAARAKQAEITIRIVDTEEMQTLNATYRQKTYATNVLSFPLSASPLIGDIAICAEVVNREAREQGKPTTSHWAHMIVHGILHILGHDHVEEAEAIHMETLEIAILQRLGFNNPYLNIS